AGSFDPGGVLSSFKWTLGDGTTSTEASPLHSYQTPGTYFATLMVTDNAGHTSSNTLMITPLAPPAVPGPVAVASATPQVGAAPLAVSFSSAGSSASIVTFRWDFGDGSGSTLPNPAHTFT